jgi:oxygen-independent coproporphyrinogen-3 oxidase
LAEDGLVEIHDGQVSATPVGRMFVRNIAMCFDAHLGKSEPRQTPTFSRTV